MGELVDFIQYKQEIEQNLKIAEKKAVLIKKMTKEKRREEADYIFLQILDLFCQKYYPDIYQRFDLFINGRL